MARADAKVDAAADKLQRIADDAAASGGVKSKLAKPLADDAAFLRKLKPSLIAKRAKGEAPTDLPPAQGMVAPSSPQLGKRPKPPAGQGPNPYMVVGLALAVGVVLAKSLDWRSHAHPRR